MRHEANRSLNRTMTNRKVFITGGTGYVGQHLLPELARRGHEVRALVRKGSGWLSQTEDLLFPRLLHRHALRLDGHHASSRDRIAAKHRLAVDQRGGV